MKHGVARLSLIVVSNFTIVTLRASEAAAQCIAISSCLFVGGSVAMITRNCVHRSSPNWVCR